MPLYDCMLLMKPKVPRAGIMDLVARVSRRVYQRNGVVTDMKSFGTVDLGYGIKKLDGRHFKGQLMQMTVMVPPSFPKEIQYLNKEDLLLRWLVVKHRDVKYGLESLYEDEGRDELQMFHPKDGPLAENGDDDDDSVEEDDGDEEYDLE